MAQAIANGLDNDDPVCIVGMACHLPGNITSPSDLWKFLMDKRSACGPVPNTRFNMDGFYRKGVNNAGTMDVPGGYFLDEDVRQFDNSFFGINNLEACHMEPQQRKLLEVVFECFESAGASLESLSGSRTGVFVGNFTIDSLVGQTRDPDEIYRYTATGCGTTILSNRISHVFNLQGPSCTLDTACSSSLYCLHVAASAIKAGDCEAAVVASVNLITAPEQMLGTAKAGVLSPTSACHSFDESADGYGRAEGISSIYLKRRSNALKDNDKIWAVVRGTAVNANGKTPGIAQPSSRLQEDVIRKAYSSAKLHFGDTDYIEAHGTGTRIGDRIEVDAISRCFSRVRESRPLLLGSSKPGLGHSEAASGLTALIKVALALEHGTIPPTYGVTKLNPELMLEDRHFQVVTEPTVWPRPLRRASINAFGYGGANAHCILESACNLGQGEQKLMISEGYSKPNILVNGVNGINGARVLNVLNGPGCIDGGSDPQKAHGELFLLPVSASSPESLRARVDQIRQVLPVGDNSTLMSLAYTLAERRTHLNAKHLIFAWAAKESSDPPSLAPELESELPASAASSNPPPVGFVLTGQGAQYAHMAQELLDNSTAFLTTIRRLDGVLRDLPPEQAPKWSLERTIRHNPDVSLIHNATRSQPVCTAIQIAIIELLQSWGVRPTAVIGHSSGEIAGAYAAGLLTSTQAILVAYFRGYVVGQLSGEGAMIAVGLTRHEAQGLLDRLAIAEDVSVACVNAPNSVTLSGSARSIDQITTELQQAKSNIFARRLPTGGRAYHSRMMCEVGASYEDLLKPLFQDCQITAPSASPGATMYSSVGFDSGGVTVLSSSTDWSRYWRDNLERPVQFQRSLETLLITTPKMHLIEIGPHPSLKGPIKQTRAAMGRNEDMLYSATLARGENAEVQMMKLAGTLFLHGHPLEWRFVNTISDDARHLVNHALPPYPWDYSSGLLWREPRISAEIRARAHPRHELLGSQQPAGNGITTTWRNILRLEEVPWLRDHKLETQIVFPAAGYLAMIIEALRQVRPSVGRLTFRNVSLNAALVVPDTEHTGDLHQDVVELHTSVAPKQLSTKTLSDEWYELSISSWVAGSTTLHCTGSVRCDSQSPGEMDEVDNPVFLLDVQTPFGEDYDKLFDLRPWYEKFERGGLIFGPKFQTLQSLQTDSRRAPREAICNIEMGPSATLESTMPYPVHPTMIDACLQAGIMSAAAGDVTTLRPFLPVFIDECRIRMPPEAARHDRQGKASIYARSTKSGVSTQRIDCNLLDPQGKSLVCLRQVRMSQYTAKIPSGDESHRERQPCLRIVWKPDLGRALNANSASQLTKNVARFVAGHVVAETQLGDDERVAAMAYLLSLYGHLNPRMRVLELGTSCDCKSRLWKEFLENDTGLRRYGAWHKGRLDKDGTLDLHNKSFNLVIIPERLVTQAEGGSWQKTSQKLASLVTPRGVVLARKTEHASSILRQALFTVSEVGSMLVARKGDENVESPVRRKRVMIVIHDALNSPSVVVLAEALKSRLIGEEVGAKEVTTIPLSQVSQVESPHEVIWVSLVELEYPFLATMNQHEMDLLRMITDQAKTILWITGADMLGTKPDPSLTLASGFSRALMLEQPALRFMVMDIGDYFHESDQGPEATCENILAVLRSDCEADDKEYIQQSGLLHISRFGHDQEINALFRRRFAAQYDNISAIQSAPLASVSPAELRIFDPASNDSIYFQQLRDVPDAQPSGFVDVQVKAISLNAKDVYALNGRVETKNGHTAGEFSGVVAAVGPDVVNVREGDRVVALTPCQFATIARVPARALHKMLPHEDPNVLPTIPVVYVTALYALRERACLQPGESVLIHSGAGAFGMATIAIAQRMGAIVYTTAGSPAKRRAITAELGVPEERIFNSRDTSFVANIKAATYGRGGVDVIVNSLVGDLLHGSWECLAPFGRFIEVGKRELSDAGRLDMSVFLRDATFSAFSLEDLVLSDNPFHCDTLHRITEEVLNLYRSGEIKPAPMAVFPVSATAKAYRHFSSKDRVGKVVVDLGDPLSQVPSIPAQYLTSFHPNKVYLLVGCLGGLGRSLSRWMQTRGASNFVFLGRSGSEKSSAKALVGRLAAAGAKVTVVRGDVSNSDDVLKAIDACRATSLAIGGVIQAAMGLREGLFSRMTSQDWHQAIQPKWAGSMHLHEALQGHDKALDFFLLMSSVSGSVGTATESNYCAANSFLDAFAQWRHNLGKPAVSVGLGMISEVGYLHENPEIEALLLRRGIQPLNEGEFLQIIDLALSGTTTLDKREQRSEEPWSAHILTGLEPFRARRLKGQGFDVTHGAMDDPRVSIISKFLTADGDNTTTTQQGAVDGGHCPVAVADWLRNVPAKALKSLKSEADASSLHAAVVRLVRKRFSNLILIPLDKIDNDKPVAKFGVDSMIASEFRTWFWSAFRVEVPFLDLLSPERTLNTLAAYVEEHLVGISTN